MVVSPTLHVKGTVHSLTRLSIDMFDRKWPWIISSLTCAFCQYYLAIYIALGKPTVGQPMSESTIAGGKGATAMTMIFGAAWSFGVSIE